MKKFAQVFSVFALSLLLGFSSLSAAKGNDTYPDSPKSSGMVTITDVTGLGMELQSAQNLNPGDAFLAYIYSAASGDATLTYSHENGETISRQNIKLDEGSNLVKCNLGHFASGLYILKVQSDAGTSQKAIIIR